MTIPSMTPFIMMSFSYLIMTGLWFMSMHRNKIERKHSEKLRILIYEANERFLYYTKITSDLSAGYKELINALERKLQEASPEFFQQRQEEIAVSPEAIKGKYMLDDNGNVIPATNAIDWAKWVVDPESYAQRATVTDITPHIKVVTKFLGECYTEDDVPTLWLTTIETNLVSMHMPYKCQIFRKGRPEAMATHYDQVERAKLIYLKKEDLN